MEKESDNKKRIYEVPNNNSRKRNKEILESGELYESYIWVDKAENTVRLFEKIETKNPRKDIQKIQQKRQKLRMKLKTIKTN